MKKIKLVSVVGAGTMDFALALKFAQEGFNFTLDEFYFVSFKFTIALKNLK